MIEVDFLPASGKKSGDCILMRFGSFSYDDPDSNEQVVVMIDSGFTDCAEKIENHIKNNYNTNIIDCVIVTHPDLDHIAGLKKILENGNVIINEIIAHDPWQHSNFVLNDLDDERRTKNSIETRFDDLFTTLDFILDFAYKNDISCSELFSGEKIVFEGFEDFSLDILGPSKGHYEELLSLITKQSLNEAQLSSDDVYDDGEDVFFWDITKYFLDNPHTSPKNECSMIILLRYKNKPFFLFTGDAGDDSLRRALNFADNEGIGVCGVQRMQIPHHGSIKNISQEVLDYIGADSYVVSASLNEENCKGNHPSKLLTNYIVGCQKKKIFHATEKHGISISWGAPLRPGWSTAQPKQRNLKLRKLKGDE